MKADIKISLGTELFLVFYQTRSFLENKHDVDKSNINCQTFLSQTNRLPEQSWV